MVETALTTADELAAFSIGHYKNKNEPGQLKYYNDYYRYYISKN